jgi:hypothetical protein
VVAALLVLASKATEGVNTGGCGTGEGSAKKNKNKVSTTMQSTPWKINGAYVRRSNTKSTR